MKAIKLYIVIISTVILNANLSYAVDYVTRANGNWNDTNTWVGGAIPPSSLNNDRIFVMPGYIVTMNDSLIFGNSCRLLIYSSAVLTINNNFTVTNSLELNVYGELIINGNFIANNNADLIITSTGTTSINGNATFGNGADISLNGDLTVTGTLTGGTGSNIIGTGDLIVGGLSGFVVASTVDVGYLPIELLLFNCIYSNNQIDIQWATASESNNDFFTIERSTDGINFIAVANVNGAGNSNRLINYEYTDKEIATTQSDKIVYYRLKQTDFDSKTSYSNTKAVHTNDQSIQTQLFPNPATPSALYLSINTIPESDLTITLFDAAGRKVNQMLINKDNISSTIDISSLISNAKGYYFIQISGDNASTSMKPLLVK